MTLKANKADMGKRELLVLRDTVIGGKRVSRGEVVPYPEQGGALLTGKKIAVVNTTEAAEAFAAEEKALAARAEKIAAARAPVAEPLVGSPKKPPKND